MEILHWLWLHLKAPHRQHPGHKPLKKFTFAIVNINRDLTITAVGRRIGHHGQGRN